MPYRRHWNTLVIGALHIAHTYLQFANMELVSLNPSLQLLHSVLPLDGRKRTHTGFTQRLDRTQQTDNSRSPSSDIPTSYAVTFIALKLLKPDITGIIQIHQQPFPTNGHASSFYIHLYPTSSSWCLNEWTPLHFQTGPPGHTHTHHTHTQWKASQPCSKPW